MGCEMYRVEIRSLMLNLQEPHQVSEIDMRDVTSVADRRLIENSESNTQKENAPHLLNEEVQGLRGNWGKSRNANQQLHEKQRRAEQRMEEEIGRMEK